MIIGSNIRNNARKFPKKTALLFNEVPYTYERMNREANQLSNWLLEAGLRRGETDCRQDTKDR